MPQRARAPAGFARGAAETHACCVAGRAAHRAAACRADPALQRRHAARQSQVWPPPGPRGLLAS
eukprot:7375854-Prymnesium_polylepis.1